MEIVEIKKMNEVKGLCHCWVAEPSPLNAIAEFKERYGFEPDVVYHKVSEKGRSSVYIPIERRANENLVE